MDAIKNGRAATVRSAVIRLGESILVGAFEDFFGDYDDVVVVPMPRSAPLVANALWPAEVICKEIVQQGLAKAVEPILRRVSAVPKSAFAAPGQRPDVQKHLDSMEASVSLVHGSRVILVDDVVTKGVTLYAGCALVQEKMPGADVRAFGLIRTLGLQPDIERIVDPVVGILRYGWGDVQRAP